MAGDTIAGAMCETDGGPLHMVNQALASGCGRHGRRELLAPQATLPQIDLQIMIWDT